MEEDSELRHWDKLMPETLELIFSKLPLQDKLTVIPCVCKSWKNVVTEPYCWQEIEIEGWQGLPETSLHRLLQLVLTRSSGLLKKLSVSGLHSDQSFSLIVDHAQSLRTLKLPGSRISDSIVAKVAPKLSTITYLDVSHCRNIGAPAIEAIGKHCKLLTGLGRIMDPIFICKGSQDDEAFAIAATMPKLKCLEISCMRVSTEGVLKIVSSCPELELLDIRGCRNVKLDDNFVKKFSALKVLGPQTDCVCHHSRYFLEAMDYDDIDDQYLAFLDELTEDFYDD